ncbi:MAG: hypothetical protein ACOYXB_11080 [Bacteroidota bacterium]
MKQRLKHIFFALTALLLPAGLCAQFALGPWYFKPVSGEFRLQGRYQYQNSLLGETGEIQQSPYLISGITLNSTSYLWRPDILGFSFSGEFNPETRREIFLSLPDRSEVRTLEKVDFRTTLFSNRNISLSSFLSLNNSLYNRENLTNIRSRNREWGSLLSCRNSIVPFTLKYRNMKWDQTETGTGRTFHLDQSSLNAHLSRSFGKTDRNDLYCSFDEYLYSYADLSTVQNSVFRFALNNSVFFDEKKNYAFTSGLSHYEHRGNQQFSKSDMDERLIFHLPYRLDLTGNYHLYRMETLSIQILTNRGRLSLRHRLYESLVSDLFADVSATAHTAYRENSLRTGLSLAYTKKLRFGRLNLDYRYSNHRNRTESESGIIRIVNEEHQLGDLEESILSKPYVVPGSVMITDMNGSVIYREGFDYLLDELNHFTRLTRIPGGLIEPGQAVLANYSANIPGNNSYTAGNHSIGAGIYLFDRLLHLYYRFGSQRYDRVEVPEYLSLNTYNQHVAGVCLYYKSFTCGAEYDSYRSTIIPYESLNAFMNATFRLDSRFLLTFNGTFRNYRLLAEETDQLYTNLSGRLAWNISAQTRLNLQAGYLKQSGRNIDLDLLTARAEITSGFRKLYIVGGISFYQRLYLQSRLSSVRSYIELIRKF